VACSAAVVATLRAAEVVRQQDFSTSSDVTPAWMSSSVMRARIRTGVAMMAVGGWRVRCKVGAEPTMMDHDIIEGIGDSRGRLCGPRHHHAS